LAGAFFGGLGCSSYALMQTAHTTPPKALRVVSGPTYVGNEYATVERAPFHVSSDFGARLGLSRSVDLGITPLMALGLALDGKVNLIHPDSAFALAPRLRLGGGLSAMGQAMLAETGVIASYRVLGRFEPYLGLGFANYWIYYTDEDRSSTPQLGANQHLAARRGYGDGLLQGTVGFDWGFSSRWGVIAEVRYWLPMQNDPGDRYRFVDSQIFALAMRYQSRE
jgi:hypothetical protein